MSFSTRLTAIAASNAGGPEYWALEATGDLCGFTNGCVDSSDNIIAIGYADSASSLARRGLVAKFNKFGKLLWEKKFSSDRAMYLNYVDVDTNDNIYIIGWAISSTAPTQWGQVIKLDPSGAVQWTRNYAASGATHTTGFVDNNNNVYAVGTDTQSKQLWIKYDADGTLLAERSVFISNFSENITNGVGIKATGEFVCSGSTQQNGVDVDGTLTKFSDVGNVSFRYRQFGGGNQSTSSVGASANGSIIYATVFSGVAFNLCTFNSSGVLSNRLIPSGGISYGIKTIPVNSSHEVLFLGSGRFLKLAAGLGQTVKIPRTITGLNIQRGVFDSQDNIILFGTRSSTDAGIIKIPGDGSGLGTWGWLTYASENVTLSIGSINNTSQPPGSVTTATGTNETIARYTEGVVSIGPSVTEITP